MTDFDPELPVATGGFAAPRHYTLNPTRLTVRAPRLALRHQIADLQDLPELDLGKKRIDIRNESRIEAHAFGTLPPLTATRGFDH